jgi:hypothetical protein
LAVLGQASPCGVKGATTGKGQGQDFPRASTFFCLFAVEWRGHEAGFRIAAWIELQEHVICFDKQNTMRLMNRHRKENIFLSVKIRLPSSKVA